MNNGVLKSIHCVPMGQALSSKNLSPSVLSLGGGQERRDRSKLDEWSKF